MKSASSQELMKSSIKVVYHSASVHERIATIISRIFGENETELMQKNTEDYRKLMIEAQDNLNQSDYTRQIVAQIKQPLTSYLQTEDILVQSNLYLRASRPQRARSEENVGWHRETFYGPNLGNAINIWTPIKGVCPQNTLRYIPESQLIPDSLIETRAVKSSHTERFSVGHKLGFNYRPKIIESGVDLTKSAALNVPLGASAIFSGNLIHGNAVNQSNCIRFSADFQVIRRSDFSSKNKNFHFSSGRAYFEAL